MRQQFNDSFFTASAARRNAERIAGVLDLLCLCPSKIPVLVPNDHSKRLDNKHA